MPRLGIPQFKVTDGPNGARGAWGSMASPSVATPVGIALGATWNPAIVVKVGNVLADELEAKGAHILLAPTVNIHRTRTAGRNFECYSEDPFLSGMIGSAYIRGIQEKGKGACIKHFVANDQEFERFSISSVVDERTLRLEYGTGAGATGGIDPVFGEYELPPLPPMGVFDVRWKLTGTQGIRRDIRDTLGGTHLQEVYTGLLQPGEVGYPFVVRWNSGELPGGTFTLRDQYGGSVFTINMKEHDSVVITDPDIVQFQLVYDAGNAVTSTVQSGWNIVSVPVTVADRQKTVGVPDIGLRCIWIHGGWICTG